MARSRALIARNSFLLLSPEIDDGTLRKATPPSIVTTGAGAVDGDGHGTTLVSADLGAGVWLNTDVIGAIVEFKSGAHAGLIRKVASFVGATNTVTLDQVVPSQVVLGVAVQLWLPTLPVVRTNGVGAADVINALATADAIGMPARDEGVDTFSGGPGSTTALLPDRYALIGMAGTNAGRAALITEDTAVGAGLKTFNLVTGSGIAGGTSSGDLFEIALLAKPADEGWVTLEAKQDVHDVPALQNAIGMSENQPSIRGSRKGGGTMAIPFHLRPMGAPSSGVTLARGPAEVGDMLRGIFQLNADGASTVDAGSAAADVILPAGETARFGIPAMVLIRGEAALVTDIGTVANHIYLRAGHLSAAPVTGIPVNGGWNLYPLGATPTVQSTCVQRFVGGRRVIHFGWLPGVKIEGLGPGGGLAKLTFEGPYDGFIDDGYTFPTLTATSSTGNRFPEGAYAQPLVARGVRCLLNGTSIPLIDATVDPGYVFEKRDCVSGFANGDGVQYVGRSSKLVLKVYASDWERMEQFHRATTLDFLLQIGNEPGRTFACACPQIEIHDTPSPALEGGKFVQTLNCNVLPSGLYATTAAAGIPDLILSYL